MANFLSLIDISGDPLYIKGFEEGRELAREKTKLEFIPKAVERLIIHTDLSDERIAFLMSVSFDFVVNIRLLLKKGK